MRHLIVLALVGMVVLAGAPAQATEGGANGYFQGTYNHFAVAIAGPPGLYLRDDAW
jgi:hypothetical protein